MITPNNEQFYQDFQRQIIFLFDQYNNGHITKEQAYELAATSGQLVFNKMLEQRELEVAQEKIKRQQNAIGVAQQQLKLSAKVRQLSTELFKD